MGKRTSEIFCEKLIDIIESKMDISFNLPDKFKRTWFEGISLQDEYTVDDCILDSDGFWRSKEMDGTDGRGHNTQYRKFWWRIEPNYCRHCKIHYSDDERAEIYAKSETKKFVLNMTKSQVCLEWDGFDLPTETHWGLRMRPIFVTIYEDGQKIYSGPPINARGWKKHLADFINDYYRPSLA